MTADDEALTAALIDGEESGVSARRIPEILAAPRKKTHDAGE